MTIIPEDAIQTERQQRSNRRLEVPIADDEIVDLLKCNECGVVQNNNDALYCLNCGNQLYPSETINVKECPSCNSGYDLSYNYCQNDGTLLEEKTVEIEIGRVSDRDSSGRIQKTENDINEKNTLGFGWGNFVMVMAFLQGFSALVLFIADIQNEYLPDRFLAFLAAAICLTSGLGLYQKRRYGLITIYVVQLINAIGGLVVITEGYNHDAYRVFQGVLIVSISIILSLYFKDREAMFT